MIRQKQKQYPTDLTDRQWELVMPLIPPAKPGGRPRETNIREVINAVFYINKTGCQWRLLPNDFPLWSSTYNYFEAWKKDGTWKKIHDTLRDQVRVKAGKKRTA